MNPRQHEMFQELVWVLDVKKSDFACRVCPGGNPQLRTATKALMRLALQAREIKVGKETGPPSLHNSKLGSVCFFSPPPLSLHLSELAQSLPPPSEHPTSTVAWTISHFRPHTFSFRPYTLPKLWSWKSSSSSSPWCRARSG